MLEFKKSQKGMFPKNDILVTRRFGSIGKIEILSGQVFDSFHLRGREVSHRLGTQYWEESIVNPDHDTMQCVIEFVNLIDNNFLLDVRWKMWKIWNCEKYEIVKNCVLRMVVDFVKLSKWSLKALLLCPVQTESHGGTDPGWSLWQEWYRNRKN